MNKFNQIHFSQDINILSIWFHEIKSYKSVDIEYHLPINTKINIWEQLLLDSKYDVYATLEEIPLLIVQNYHRKKLKEFYFTQWYINSSDKICSNTIFLDEDGSLKDDCYGGFFGHRMKYLR